MDVSESLDQSDVVVVGKYFLDQSPWALHVGNEARADRHKPLVLKVSMSPTGFDCGKVCRFSDFF